MLMGMSDYASPFACASSVFWRHHRACLCISCVMALLAVRSMAKQSEEMRRVFNRPPYTSVR